MAVVFWYEWMLEGCGRKGKGGRVVVDGIFGRGKGWGLGCGVGW